MKNRVLIVLSLVALLLMSLPLAGEASTCDPVRHVVKAGENLTQIARAYGVTVAAIVSANNLWNPNLIYVGQVLLIPVPCTPPPTRGCTAIHIVKRGEYLKAIALRYGTTVSVLVQLNNIRNPNLIYPGQRLKVPVACPHPTPTPPPPPITKPWKGQYWDNRLLSGAPKFTRNEALVDFNWGTSGPGGGIEGTTFSARWTRTKYFDAGRYRFNVRVDDGVRVWLDGILIIDEWHDTPPQYYSVVKELSSGNHTLQIDYYQNQGTAQIKFWPDYLEAAAAWKGEFFNNTGLEGAPVVTQFYPTVDFDWSNRSPAAGVTADYFSARFSGEFQFVGGKYQFLATADDGIRLYLDDTLILDQWRETAVRTYTVDVDIAAGKHKVRVEYFENKGAAVCKVRWTQK
ncbi:MAG: PA14 domain-containing protein [Anaerolineae bacterium]